MTKQDLMPNSIWLEPKCCADKDQGQIWCDHDAWDCEDGKMSTKYIRADLIPQQDALPSEVMEAVDILKKWNSQYVLVAELVNAVNVVINHITAGGGEG